MLVVPYVRTCLSAQTEEWAAQHGAVLWELDLADDAYHQAFSRWWATPGDLVIVEHDMVPAPGVVAEMFDCPEEWCTSPYRCARTQLVETGFGCVKFAHSLKARHPELPARAGEQCGEIALPGCTYHDDWPAGVWWVMDSRAAHHLLRWGYEPHRHAESTHLDIRWNEMMDHGYRGKIGQRPWSPRHG